MQYINTSFCRLLKGIISVAAVTVALIPAPAHAGAIQALHRAMVTAPGAVDLKQPSLPTPPQPKPAAATALKIDPKDLGPVKLGLDDKGDVAIRHGDVSVVMGYTAPKDTLEPKERMNVAQTPKQEVPAINGISLKVNLIF